MPPMTPRPVLSEHRPEPQTVDRGVVELTRKGRVDDILVAHPRVQDKSQDFEPFVVMPDTHDPQAGVRIGPLKILTGSGEYATS